MKKNVIWIVLALVAVVAGVYWYQQKGSDGEDDNVVRIGAILPLTGVAAEPARDAMNGMKTAVEEINRSGGINGKRLELIIEDSKNDPKTGLTAYKKINSTNNVKYYVSQISNVSTLLKTETEKNNQVLISMIGLIGFTDNTQNCYRNFIAPETIGKHISIIISDSLQSDNNAIIYPQTEYGKSIFESSNSFLIAKKNGFKNAFSYDENNPSFKQNAIKVISTNVNTIFIAGIGKNIGNYIKTFRELGFKGNIVCDHTSAMPDVTETAGRAIDGIYYYDFPEIGDKFKTEYFNKFNVLPSYFSGLGYNSVDFILKSQDPNIVLENTYGNYTIEGKEFIYPFNIKTYKWNN